MRPAAAERDVRVRVARDVEHERVVPHLFVAVGGDVPDDDAVAGLDLPGRGSRCRRSRCGGSAAPATPSAGPPRPRRRCGLRGRCLSSSNCSGLVRNAYMPCAVALRVVSFPATASSSMNMSNSSSLELLALDLGVEELGDDVVARVARGAARRARWRRRTARRTRACWSLSMYSGSPAPTMRLVQSNSLRRSSCGHAHDLGDGLQRQLGGDVLDEVGRARSRSRCRRSRWRGGCSACSRRPIMRGVKPLFTSSR